MGRAKVEIDKIELVSKINQVELDGPLENRSILADKLASIFDVSVATINNRLRDFNLFDTLKTPKGKRGRQVGDKPIVKTLVDGELSEQTQCADKAKAIARLKAHMGPKLHKLIDKSEHSRTAAMKLMCIECCGGLQEDCNPNSPTYKKMVKIPVITIKECGCLQCPQYIWRPYQ